MNDNYTRIDGHCTEVSTNDDGLIAKVTAELFNGIVLIPNEEWELKLHAGIAKSGKNKGECQGKIIPMKWIANNLKCRGLIDYPAYKRYKPFLDDQSIIFEDCELGDFESAFYRLHDGGKREYGFNPDGPMIYLENKNTHEILPLLLSEMKFQKAISANAFERVFKNHKLASLLMRGLPVYPYVVYAHGPAFDLDLIKHGIYYDLVALCGKTDENNALKTDELGRNAFMATCYATGTREISSDFLYEGLKDMLNTSLGYYLTHDYNGVRLLKYKEE